MGRISKDTGAGDPDRVGRGTDARLRRQIQQRFRLLQRASVAMGWNVDGDGRAPFGAELRVHSRRRVEVIWPVGLIFLGIAFLLRSYLQGSIHRGRKGSRPADR